MKKPSPKNKYITSANVMIKYDQFCFTLLSNPTSRQWVFLRNVEMIFVLLISHITIIFGHSLERPICERWKMYINIIISK